MANRQHFQLGSNAVLYHILVEHHFAKLHLVIAAPASSSQSRGHSHLCNPPGPAMEPEGSTLAHVFEIFWTTIMWTLIRWSIKTNLNSPRVSQEWSQKKSSLKSIAHEVGVWINPIVVGNWTQFVWDSSATNYAVERKHQTPIFLVCGAFISMNDNW